MLSTGDSQISDVFKCVFLVSVDLLLGVLSTHFSTFRATSISLLA